MSLMISPEHLVLFCAIIVIGFFINFYKNPISIREKFLVIGKLVFLSIGLWGLLLFATNHRRIASQILSDTTHLQRIIFFSVLIIGLIITKYLSDRWQTPLRNLYSQSTLFIFIIAVLADTLSSSFRMYLRQISLINQHEGPEYASNLISTILASFDITSITFLYDLFILILFVSGLILLKTRSIKTLIFGEGTIISLIVTTGLYVQVFNMTLNLEVGYAVDILSQDFTILSFYQFTLLFSVFMAFILSILSAIRLTRLNLIAIAEAEIRKAEEVRNNMIEQQRKLEKLVKIRTAELDAEHKRSEKLLRNILPEVIAERLKSEESAIAENYEGTTVLFADIVGFTPLSAKMSAYDLVHILNKIFSEFDDIAERNGMEKIKTIGDAYMVTAGLPEPREDHALAAIKMAKEMLEVMDNLDPIEGKKLQIRIGLNSGSVVAGVIGKKKFAYDLWGDVVNTAARMEAHGIAGRIQMTQATKSLIEEEYDVEERGVMEIKGKGPMNLFLLKN